MIRERVSTHGIIRPLEADPELLAMLVSPELIGTPSEHALRRYVAGSACFEKKFARTLRRIAKQCKQYLERERTNANTDGYMEWELDTDERLPPSSIVARRDTGETLRLAHVADKAVLASEQVLSANSLRNVVIGLLTASPSDCQKARRKRG